MLRVLSQHFSCFSYWQDCYECKHEWEQPPARSSGWTLECRRTGAIESGESLQFASCYHHLVYFIGTVSNSEGPAVPPH